MEMEGGQIDEILTVGRLEIGTEIGIWNLILNFVAIGSWEMEYIEIVK